MNRENIRKKVTVNVKTEIKEKNEKTWWMKQYFLINLNLNDN